MAVGGYSEIHDPNGVLQLIAAERLCAHRTIRPRAPQQQNTPRLRN